MTMHKRILALGFIMLWLPAVACNLGTVLSERTSLPASTLTPPATSEFVTEEPTPDSEFFVEEFDEGVPEGWSSSGGWSVRDGALTSESAEAVLEIPGNWQDMSLFTRLRFESDGVAVEFNRSDSGVYRINLTREGLSLDWQPLDGGSETLSVGQVLIDSDWHDLVLRQAHGRVDVWLDGKPALKRFNVNLWPSSSLALVNESAGLLEIDRLVVAPAGMGPGLPTPAPASAQAALDLAVVDVSVEETGELIVWLINNGPDSTQGRNIALTISVAAEDPAIALILDPLPIFIDREWVNLFPVETGILLDASYAGRQVTVSLQPLDFRDPDQANNDRSQILPAWQN